MPRLFVKNKICSLLFLLLAFCNPVKAQQEISLSCQGNGSKEIFWVHIDTEYRIVKIFPSSLNASLIVFTPRKLVWDMLVARYYIRYELNRVTNELSLYAKGKSGVFVDGTIRDRQFEWSGRGRCW